VATFAAIVGGDLKVEAKKIPAGFLMLPLTLRQRDLQSKSL